MSEQTDLELQDLKRQLALLQRAQAGTENCWLKWLRATGVLLLVYAASIFLGVLMSHGKVASNPVAISFVFTALFMSACGLWCLLWSFRWMAEKLISPA